MIVWHQLILEKEKSGQIFNNLVSASWCKRCVEYLLVFIHHNYNNYFHTIIVITKCQICKECAVAPTTNSQTNPLTHGHQSNERLFKKKRKDLKRNGLPHALLVSLSCLSCPSGNIFDSSCSHWQYFGKLWFLIEVHSISRLDRW